MVTTRRDPVLSAEERENAFVELCDDLRANNDPHRLSGLQLPLNDSVRPLEAPYGARLNAALLQNSTVTYLSITTGTTNTEGSTAETNDDAILQCLPYLRTGITTALREVYLAFTSATDLSCARACLLALADNVSMQLVRISDDGITGDRGGTTIPWDALAELLTRTVSLKSLDLHVGDDTESNELVAAAFGRNQTLQKLHLCDWHAANKPTMIRDILFQMAANPNCRLETLDISDAAVRDCASLPHTINALSSLLEAPTSTLTSLKLHGTFNLNRTERLVQSLRIKKSLLNLELFGIKFEEDATPVFVTYMQTSDESVEDDPTQIPFSDTRKLTIVEHDDMFENGDVTRIIPTMFQGRPRWNALELGNPNNYDLHFGQPTFWDALGDSATDNRLRSLTIYVERASLTAIEHCLPKLVHLKELEIIFCDDTVMTALPDSVLRALRRNGSLRQVSFGYRPPSSNTEHDRAEQLLNAIVERNRMLPLMLSRSRTMPVTGGKEENPNNPGTEAMLNDGDGDCYKTVSHTRKRRIEHLQQQQQLQQQPQEEAISPSSPPATDRKLFPPLLLTGQQAPRMAPHFVIQGLLAL